MTLTHRKNEYRNIPVGDELRIAQVIVSRDIITLSDYSAVNIEGEYDIC